MLIRRLNHPLVVAAAAFVALLTVQAFFEAHDVSWLIVITLFSGLAAWSWCVWRQPPHQDRPLALAIEPVTWANHRLMLICAAFACAILAWTVTDGNSFTPLGVSTWLGAVGLWMAAWVPWRLPTRPMLPPAERLRRRWAFLLVCGITLLGAWLRFYRLDSMPYAMTQDHGWKLLDIHSILTGQRPIFFPNNTGREPWQFYYIATLIRLFDLPLQFIALKIGNALIGSFTIPLMYLFGREVGGRKLGLATAFLYAIAKWPIATTRMGLRFPYATLPATLILIHLWRYMRTGKVSDALFAGFWMGFGLYGYIGIRVLPLVILLVFTVLLWRAWRRKTYPLQPLVTHALLMFVTVILVFLPLSHFMLQYPQVFWYRAVSRTASVEQAIDQSVCMQTPFDDPDISYHAVLCRSWIFMDNNRRALQAFNWRGDRNEVNHVRFDPLLDWVTATLLLAALPIIAWQLYRRSLRWWLLLAALPILLLTTTLSLAFPLENPSTSRTGVVMPVIFTMAALPLALGTEWVLGYTSWHTWRTVARSRLIALLVIGCSLGGLALQQNYVRYFRDLAAQYRYFVPNTGEIAQEITDYSQQGIANDNTYVLTWPYWIELRNLSVYLSDIFWHETHAIEPQQALPVATPGQPMLFVLNINDHSRQAELLEQFPIGELQIVETELRHQRFMTFFVPAH